MVLLRALCLAFTLLLSLVNCDEFYPIDWAQVASTETTVKPKDLVKCLCDLTFFQCDPNCCCDGDCSADEKALFTGCDVTGEPQDDTICIDAGDVSVVNRVSASEKDGQLCVVRNNNPSLGLFFANPKPVTATNFEDFSSINPSDFADVAQLPESFSVPSYSSSYKVGDTILKTGSPKTALALPKGDIFGRCSISNPAVFLYENQTYTCNVYSSNLASDCASLFATTPYVQGINVAKTPGDTGGAAIIINSVDGVVGASVPTPALSGSTCNTALQKLAYIVVYDGSGTIVNVSADIWTTTVSDWGNSLGGSVLQTFSIQFINGNSPPTTVRSKSGNPGYLIGKPLLLGNATSNDGIIQAILQPTSPLTLLGSSATGTCVTGQGPSLSFGDDVIIGCRMPAPSALSDGTTCQAFVTSIMGVIRGETVPTHVGKFGNTDYLNIYEWASIFEVTPDASTFNSAENYCTNIPNQIHFQFITTYAGPLITPQSTIVAGQINYTTIAVRATQPFVDLYASVSFVNVAAMETLQENLPAPPLMKPLPDDILYPFKLSSATFLHPHFFVTLCYVYISLSIAYYM